MFFKKKAAKKSAIQITDQNFQEIALETDKGVLIDFWAPKCGPCSVMSSIVDELASQFGDEVIIAKVNTHQNPNLSATFNIKSIPTFVFLKDKKMIENIKGLIPKPNLEEMIHDLINYEFEEEEVIAKGS